MRFKDAPKQQKAAALQKDALESYMLHGVLNELQDRQVQERWKTIPDAKVKPRPKTPDTIVQVLAGHGLACLDDLVALPDLLDMRSGIELQDGHDRDRRAQLRHTLHEIAADPKIKSSYQYLANKTSVTSEEGGVWQVQISRRRLRQQERMSRDHHEEEDGITDEKLVDAHGNMILPLIEAAGRVATAKEMRRIKRMTAQRRRAGEQIFTDDEMESANLAPPPEPIAKPKAKPKARQPARCYVSPMVVPSIGLMYLDPPEVSEVSQGSTSATDDSDTSWMLVGGSIVARSPSGSWS